MDIASVQSVRPSKLEGYVTVEVILLQGDPYTVQISAEALDAIIKAYRSEPETEDK